MTVHSPLALLKSRKFGPLFLTQFLGAANDNVFKNALVILVVYQLGEGAGIKPAVMGTLAAASFILPFFLFSATAGQLADRYEKSAMIRVVKVAEVALMLLAAVGFITLSPWFLLFVLFLLGTQATFFGPLKYAILPDHLSEDDLIGGNALIEGGTFLAILLGTIAGGLLVLSPNGTLWVAGLVVALAGAGLAASRAIPHARVASPSLEVSFNVWRETIAIVCSARERRDVFLAILGISWFWLVGATYLSQFPAFTKDVLGADNQVVTFFLTLFSLGIGLGSLLCSKLLKGEISAAPVPLAALAITVFSFDLAVVAEGADIAGGMVVGLPEFLSRIDNWRIIADLLLVSVSGGIYAVPLYAILQARADESRRARTIAANNVLNALFMTLGALVTALLLAVGVAVTGVFLLMAVANAIVAIVICGLLPETTLKILLSRLLRLAFRVDVKGLENVAATGERVLIVANHVSLLDAVLLAVFLPGRPTFAVNTQVAQWWWVAPFLKIIDAFPLDPSNPLAIKSLARAVEQGRHVVIFPEGRITVTGALMKVYDGPGLIADKAGADILPIHIEGAQYSLASYLKGKVRRRLFPKITLTVLPPRRIDVPAALKGRARRRAAGEQLYTILSEMAFATAPVDRTLPQALLEAKARHGGGHVVMEDIERKPMTFRRLVVGILALGRALAAKTGRGEAVAVLLPNTAGTAVTLFALQMFGRVPAMFNFTAGSATLEAACTAARIRLLVTSRRFVEAARLDEVVERLATKVDILWLEDVRVQIGTIERLRAFASLPFAGRIHARHADGPDSPAVILFTSGSEGTPKGVVLSHRNILANCAQLAARIDFSSADTVLAALPVFHAFGLTGGLLLPLLAGVKVFLYPSPLHYRVVPEIAYDTNATILFGTDTFLAGYARVAHPLDFRSLRYVFAGAEKVKDETRRVWAEKFGLRVLEGYGATETAPVLALNTPHAHLAGSVGRLLPGIEARLDPVPGIAEGGRLIVRGPNVMAGYLKVDRPGELQPPTDGWYDTGDIVAIDAQGFVRILGRAKRFAKVAGEMISLGAVEEAVDALWPGFQHAVLALPDERKGERLVLMTSRPGTERAEVSEGLRARGVSELAVPRSVVVRDKLPLLGTGKIDYVALARDLAAGAGYPE